MDFSYFLVLFIGGTGSVGTGGTGSVGTVGPQSVEWPWGWHVLMLAAYRGCCHRVPISRPHV